MEATNKKKYGLWKDFKENTRLTVTIAIVGIVVMIFYRTVIKPNQQPSDAEVAAAVIQYNQVINKEMDTAMAQYDKDMNNVFKEMDEGMGYKQYLTTTTPQPVQRVQAKTTHVPVSAISVSISDYVSEAQYRAMGCKVGTIKYDGYCMSEIEFLKTMNDIETTILNRREARGNAKYDDPANWYQRLIDEAEGAEIDALEDAVADGGLNCPLDSQITYKGICIEYDKAVKLRAME